MALAALLGAIAIAALLVPAGQADDPPEPVAIAQGHVDWGLRESFRNYIGNAGIAVADGATRNSDGTFRFPVQSGSFDATTNTTSVTLGGSVHFTAHEGALDMTLSAPRVTISRAGSQLVADVVSKSLDSGETVVYDDLAVADLDIAPVTPTVAGGQTTWTAIPAALTGAAVPAFSNFYVSGAPLDAVTLVYDGPGAKPDLTEEWTAPGTPLFEQVGVNATGNAYALIPDPARGVLHVGTPAGMRALDLATLELRATSASASMPQVGYYTFDPVHGTVFALGTAGNPIRAFTYDKDTGSYTASTVAITSAALMRLAYDPGTEKLYSIAGTGNPATPIGGGPTPAVTVAKRNGSGWDVTAYPALASGGRGVAGLNVIDGKIVANLYARYNGTLTPENISPTPVHQLTDTGSELTLTEIPSSLPPTPASSYTFGFTTTQAGAGTSGVLVENAPLAPVTHLLPIASSGGGFTTGTPIDIGAQAYATTVDRVNGTTYVSKPNLNRTLVIRDDAIVGAITQPPTDVASFAPANHAAHDGTYYFINNVAPVKLFAYRNTANSPTVTAQPDDATATIGLGEHSVPVTFTVAATGTPVPTLRWQVRRSAGASWQDVPGATSATLAFDALRSDEGSDYRAVFENIGGAIASDPAALEVLAVPAVLVQPPDVTVAEGATAVLKVGPAGNPYPDIQWQRRVDGFWIDVQDADDGFLTLEDANLDMSGTKLRARLSNDLATVYTRTTTLTVEPAPPVNVSFGSGYADWGVKQSFRTYIGGPIAHGSYAASGEAVVNPDGTIRFAVVGGSYDTTAGTGEIDLSGAVRFSGHDSGSGPLLDLTITNPRVVLAGDDGALRADVVSKSQGSGLMESFPDVALATLDLSGGEPTPTGQGLAFGPFPGTLTVDGAPAFGGFYSAGAELDPLSINAIYGLPRKPPVVVAKTDPPATKPPVARARVKAAARRQRVGPKGVFRFARVSCRRGPCKVVVPKKVTFKIAGKKHSARVVGPRLLGNGDLAYLRAKLNRATLRSLAGRKATVRLRIVVRSGGRSTASTVKVKIGLPATKVR
jgi:hypothetical protein